LLKADGNSVEIITDEDEVITFASDISERHPSCLTLTAEVWWVDGTWMVADCLWWNATKVAELPFPWRLSFAQKISDALVMPLVKVACDMVTERSAETAVHSPRLASRLRCWQNCYALE
jgi:hypothetical protein